MKIYLSSFIFNCRGFRLKNVRLRINKSICMYEKYISWKKVKMIVWKHKWNLVIGIELFTVGLNFEETSKEKRRFNPSYICFCIINLLFLFVSSVNYFRRDTKIYNQSETCAAIKTRLESSCCARHIYCSNELWNL